MVWAVALVAAASSGCRLGDLTAPDLGEPAIRTDSAAYTLRRIGSMLKGTIGFTYTNRTGGDVLAHGCGAPDPPRLEKLVGDAWVVVYSPVVLACWTPPVRIGAGQTYRYALQMYAALPGANALPRWEGGEAPGIYRLVWGALSAPTPLPPEVRTSNAFTLSVE
jgi:hypothetical protein